MSAPLPESPKSPQPTTTTTTTTLPGSPWTRFKQIESLRAELAALKAQITAIPVSTKTFAGNTQAEKAQLENQNLTNKETRAGHLPDGLPRTTSERAAWKANMMAKVEEKDKQLAELEFTAALEVAEELVAAQERPKAWKAAEVERASFGG